MSNVAEPALSDAAELHVEFPRKPEYVRTVRQAVATLARLSGGDDGAVEDIKLAVSEACNTTVTHPEASADTPVELFAQPSADGLVVELLDREARFDHAVAGPPGEIDTGDLPFEQALALPIIRGLAAEVAVEALAGGGTRMRMVLSLGPAGAG
jgi:serine/threonine-protein kinase RsbW